MKRVVRQSIHNALVYIAVLVLRGLSWLPLSNAYFHRCAIVFYWISRIFAGGRKTIALYQRNINFAYPNLSPKEHEVLANEHWRSMYYTFFKESPLIPYSHYLHLTQRIKKSLQGQDTLITVEGLEHFTAIKNQAAVYSIPHMHCLEVASIAIGALHDIFGRSFCFVAKDPKDAVSNRITEKNRTLIFGDHISHKNTRALLTALKNKSGTVTLADQYITIVKPVQIKFFNRDLQVQPSIARLLKTTKAALVPIGIFRDENLNYRLHIEKPLLNPADKDLAEITQFMYDGFEKSIRRCPAQYIWDYEIFFRKKGMNPSMNTEKNKEQE